MSEDWSGIAAEVDEALRSIADDSQPNGYPSTLRTTGSTFGPDWNPTAGTPTYVTLYGFEDTQELRDVNGTLIGQTKRTLIVSAQPGIVPTDDDQVAVGVAEADLGDDTVWTDILVVRPLSPVGVAILYEIDLVT